MLARIATAFVLFSKQLAEEGTIDSFTRDMKLKKMLLLGLQMDASHFCWE